MDIRAQRISAAITQSGLSYVELEKKTGVSKSSLQRYATGGTEKIPIDAVEAIAAATGTDARYLLGWDVPTEQTDAPRAQLLAAFDQLSAEGQQRVIDYAVDLVASGRYKKTTADTVGDIA